MNSKELIDKLAEVEELSATDLKRLCNRLFELIAFELSHDNSVRINKFGTFDVKQRKPMVGFNNKTGENLRLPEKKYIVFRTADALEELINN